VHGDKVVVEREQQADVRVAASLPPMHLQHRRSRSRLSEEGRAIDQSCATLACITILYSDIVRKGVNLVNTTPTNISKERIREADETAK
jgi:hypothetical protein